jgi:hypothetical protein
MSVDLPLPFSPTSPMVEELSNDTDKLLRAFFGDLGYLKETFSSLKRMEVHFYKLD